MELQWWVSAWSGWTARHLYITKERKNFNSSTQLSGEIIVILHHGITGVMRKWEKMETKTSLQLTWAGQKNILNNYIQRIKSIPRALNNISIVNVNKRTHTKFPSLVPTKSHTTYNQQKDQNRLWGGEFQYWRCSPHMCQASWISFGIIVTLLPCMVQRFTSSMSLTKYASAASSRHMMACPWKCRLYLPTARAILWTNHEKGCFQMRSSVLFWNQWIWQRAKVPSLYFWVFFSFPTVKNSFLGALPPTVGWSFFLAGSSPPNVEGLASAAIWANCCDGSDCSDLPASCSHFTSTTLLLISSWSGGVSSAGDGGLLV